MASAHRSKTPAYMDHGWAWVVLGGCFIVQMLAIGMFWCLGVFLIAWEQQLSDSVTKLQWIVSLLLLFAHISAVIGSSLCRIYTIRQVALFGTALATTSYALASCSTALWHLYATFAIAGIGIGLVMQTTMVIPTYYFKKRLARANGIAHAAAGFALFVIPPIAQFLIDKYGWQGALLIISGLVANSAVGAATFRPSPLELEIRSKLNNKKFDDDKQYMELDGKKDPLACQKSNQCAIEYDAKNTADDSKQTSFCNSFFDFELLKDVKCLSLFTTFLWFSLGYTMGTMFMPARADSVGISTYQAAILVSIQGGTSTVARLTHGYILDFNIMSPAALTATSNIVNALCFILNPLSDNYAYLAAISAVFGFSSGVTNSVIPVLSSDFVGTHKLSEAVAITLVTFGLGTLAGSCMTGVLVDYTSSYTVAFFLGGTSFILAALFIISPSWLDYIRKCYHRRSTCRPLDSISKTLDAKNDCV